MTTIDVIGKIQICNIIHRNKQIWRAQTCAKEADSTKLLLTALYQKITNFAHLTYKLLPHYLGKYKCDFLTIFNGNFD